MITAKAHALALIDKKEIREILRIIESDLEDKMNFLKNSNDNFTL